MPSSSPSGRSSSQARSRTGRLLMIVAALAAAVTAISSIAALSSTTVETRLLEAWRAYGLVVFAGLFVLLGLRPHAYRGVWELVVFHKTALTGTALVFAARGGATGTGTVVLADGVLTVLLLASYVLCRGWRSASRAQRATDT